MTDSITYNHLKAMATYAKRGRPVSTGSGRRVSFYAPVRLLQLIERICKEWNIQNQSEFIQEAIVRYAAELDAINMEGERYGKEHT